MNKLKVILLFMLFMRVSAQDTGYTDLFEAGLNFTAPPSFNLSQSKGILTVDVIKEASKKWQGIETGTGNTIDISNNPVLNLKLKSDTHMLLSVQIFDAFSIYTTRDIKIYPSEDFVTYTIDFSNSPAVNKKIINKIKLTPNGNKIGEFRAKLELDEVNLGNHAVLFASAGAVPTQKVFTGSTNNKFLFLDLYNAESVILNEAGGSIENIMLSEIIENKAEIAYDIKEGFSGIDSLSLLVKGKTGFEDNEIKIRIDVEENKPPYFENISDQSVLVGDTLKIPIAGISDGNKTVEQQIVFTALSNNQSVLPDSNLVVNFENGNSYGEIYLSAVGADSSTIITVQANDSYSANNLFERSFKLYSYHEINNPPSMDNPDDHFVYIEEGLAEINLTGINSGDKSDQNISFSFESSNQSVVANQDISIDYIQGSLSAKLSIIPKSVGSTIITVVLADDGGNVNNNGNQSVEVKFNFEIGNIPKNGDVADFTSFSNWGRDFNNGQQDYELGSFHGKDDVLKITLNNKSCWTGTTYCMPELNLDKNRYMSYEIYFEGKSFETSGVGKTHAYFYDIGSDPNVNRNVNAAHDRRKTVSINKWHTIYLDFRAAHGMDNNNGEELDVKRIRQVLLNYASDFTWPFPSDDGAVYIANLKVGDTVPDSLIPAVQTKCTISQMPDIVVFAQDEITTIKLSGISNGKNDGNKPIINGVFSDSTLFDNIELSEVNDSAQAVLSFLPNGNLGKSIVTITVSSENADPKSISFTISLIDNALNKTVDVELFPTVTYQTMRGFGTFYFPENQHYTNYYTDDLGASAVRIGIIGNQIEPENDNDDPNVLDMNAFNYGAFDFEYLKRLKSKGIETFILTSWSPPAWMKRNLSVDYGYASAPDYSQTDNVLEPYYYDEFAESMVAAVKMLKSEADIDLYAIGIQNEPAFNEPYASAVLSPAKFAELVGIVGERFEREGITTKLFMPEQVFSQSHYAMAHYINAIIARPESEKYVDIIATHAYGEDGIKPGQPSYPGWVELWKKSQECQSAKELWMSETYPECKSYNDAFSLAGAIHGAIKYGNISFWTLWNIEGTLMKNSQKIESFYTSKNFYKFIRPGAVRIGAESDHEDIMVTSYKDNKNNSMTTVIINKNSNPLTMRLLSRTDSIPAIFDVYQTAEHVNFEYRGEIEPNSTLSLPARSVTTLHGNTGEDLVVGAEEVTAIPVNYKLYNNYPNPFNPVTTIKYELAKNTKVKLTVFDILGREVNTIVKQYQSAGSYLYKFDAGNLASGVYFYRLLTDNFSDVKKMILLK